MTLGNLSLGMAAILIVTKEKVSIDMLFIASFLVALAALADRFDGKLARRLNAESELGKELDSLADLVSFGIAPMVVAWRVGLYTIGWIGVIVCIIYPVAGAFRLAKFNTTVFEEYYTGIPITIAGAIMALVNIFNCYLMLRDNVTPMSGIITSLLALLLAYLMVSRFQIRKR